MNGLTFLSTGPRHFQSLLPKPTVEVQVAHGGLRPYWDTLSCYFLYSSVYIHHNAVNNYTDVSQILAYKAPAMIFPLLTQPFTQMTIQYLQLIQIIS